MYRSILLLIYFLLLAACNVQISENIKLATGNKEIQEIYIEEEFYENHDFHELVGMKTIKGITYSSIFTKKSLRETAQYYHAFFQKSSTRSNVIVLFYNNKGNTPLSRQFKRKRKWVNESLIGGIERSIGGPYYLLSVNKDNQLYREGILNIIIKN